MTNESQRTEGEQDQAVGEDLEPQLETRAEQEDWARDVDCIKEQGETQEDGHLETPGTPLSKDEVARLKAQGETPGQALTDDQVEEFQRTGTVKEFSNNPGEYTEGPGFDEHNEEVADYSAEEDTSSAGKENA